MAQFGWAFIGTGDIARQVAVQIQKEGSCRIAAVWNRTAERAQAFAEEFGTRAFATPEEALAAPGVEGAYVCVNASHHAEYVRRCLAAGVPVLCEKPFTINEADSVALFAMAKERGLYLSEAMWTWHNATALRVKEKVQSGALGRIRSVRAVYAFPLISMQKYRGRLLSPEAGGGALLDIGVYPVRYVYELFGAPEEMICRGSLRGGVDLSDRIRMRYNGFDADIFISISRLGGEKLVIRGEKGSIYVPHFHEGNGAVIKCGKEKEVFSDDSLLYGKQFAQVAAEIRAGKQESAFIPAAGTLAVMRLLDACRAQLGLRYPAEE